MQHALYLAPFGELADPRVVAELAIVAEEAGWDGFFLWDHVLRPPDDPAEIADVWVTLAAVATATRRMRLGPLVTPIVRRRPQKLAREVVTLDRLSSGRLVLGLGLGVDSGGELSRFGEVVDARTRGDVLDEGAGLLAALLSGERVDHHGDHFTVDGVTMLPTAEQSPRVPMWFAARGDARRPVRRAARYDGLFPIEVDADGLARMLDIVVAERGDLDGFDVAVRDDEITDLAAAEALGATWSVWSFLPDDPAASIERAIGRGPGARG